MVIAGSLACIIYVLKTVRAEYTFLLAWWFWWLSSLQHMQHIWPNTFKVSDESAMQYNSVFTYQAINEYRNIGYEFFVTLFKGVIVMGVSK